MYLADVDRTWEELLVTVQKVHIDGEVVLARGRVYARSRKAGLRDLPVTWHWRLRDRLFAYGRVFDGPTAAREARCRRFQRGALATVQSRRRWAPRCTYPGRDARIKVLGPLRCG